VLVIDFLRRSLELVEKVEREFEQEPATRDAASR
jgi:hypothetical protein